MTVHHAWAASQGITMLLDTDLHMAICKGTLLKDNHQHYIFQLQWVIKFHSGRVIHQDQRCPLPLTCPPTRPREPSPFSPSQSISCWMPTVW